MENQVITDLEMNEPRTLFNHKRSCNRVDYLNNIDRKVFMMMCKNFFIDMKNEHNMKTKTLKYWFLHNLSLLIELNMNIINDFDGISDELDILLDYFRVVFLGEESRVDRYIFLPVMRMFSSWCNVTNVEKVEIHHGLIRDLVYLDDNYFFLMNYFRSHNVKFLSQVVRNKYEMDNGNNVMIHVIRSANFKNNDCAFRNFKKIVNFLFKEIWDGHYMEILTKKNNNGKKAINLFVYLRENFYEYLMNRVFMVCTHKEFMDRYFSGVTKYINRYFQLEMILQNVDLFYPEKYENLYNKLVKNSSIQFYEKFLIINALREFNLISIENDKEVLGRKLWEELGKK